ncbi:unnamed protein product [Urochloa decumbens]|uniref:Uncharacterized protein n=1 Tax=Urochloa decumbens TaxID=240449 RepID=A0ABC8YZE5_9POAL
MKQKRSWCQFISHKLLLVLMSMVVLAVMLIGFLTGVLVNMGGRVDVMSPPAPTSGGSPHSASIFPDNG